MSLGKFIKRLFRNKEKPVNSLDQDTGISPDIRPEYLESVHSQAPEKRPVELNIGLDFGTAFTKVVVGDNTTHYAIPFDTVAEGSSPYLLPCILLVDEEGYCQAGYIENPSEQFSHLKMQLLDGTTDDECLIKIATFLALVIEHTRNWLLSNHSSQYADRLPDWSINVGLPTDSFHHEPLKGFYHKALVLAWNISLSDEMVTLDLAERIYLNPDCTERLPDCLGNRLEYPLHPDKIGLFPEFAAQITGYVNSPMRQPGLHSLVDIGAGTIDITVFNVTENASEGTQLYPIFTKCVLNLGVAYLFRKRLESSGYTGQWVLDETTNAPNDKETAEYLDVDISELKRIDASLGKVIRQEFITQLRHTKNNRYRNSPRWKTGVPLFLCGGGARLGFYQSLFDEIEGSARLYPIKQVSLPRPDRLTAPGLDDTDIDRLSVAYGLSFGALDIGEIRPEDEVDDDNGFVTSDSGPCGRCGGTGGARANDCPSCGGTGWT